VRHHLLERRVGDKEIVDLARVGGIGAAQLQRRGRAVGFGVARIGCEAGNDPIGGADDRIETLKGVVAVEQGIGARQVLQVDLGVVEATAPGQRELRGDIEGVRRVHAHIGVVGGEIVRG
jgi:hypothetical protein